MDMTLKLYIGNEQQREAFIAMATAMNIKYVDSAEEVFRASVRRSVMQTRVIRRKVAQGKIKELRTLDDVLKDMNNEV